MVVTWELRFPSRNEFGRYTYDTLRSCKLSSHLSVARTTKHNPTIYARMTMDGGLDVDDDGGLDADDDGFGCG